MKKPFVCYAVARGRTVGIFDKWPACAASVKGYGSAARYRGFYSRHDAEDWLNDELGRMDEARRAHGKQSRKADTAGGEWRFIPATEPIDKIEFPKG